MGSHYNQQGIYFSGKFTDGMENVTGTDNKIEFQEKDQ